MNNPADRAVQELRAAIPFLQAATLHDSGAKARRDSAAAAVVAYDGGGGIAGAYLDWLADEMDRTTCPQRINTIKRVAGNVRTLAGI